MSPSARRWIAHGLRLAVTAGAAAWVVRQIPFRDQVRTVDGVETLRPGLLTLLQGTDPLAFGLLSLALLVPMLLLALRWWLLLRGHGFEAPFGRIFFVTYAGSFFNNFLPGSVGGDLTKAVLASSGESRKAAVAGTVILDRLVGLAVMVLLGAACITPVLGRLSDRRVAYGIYAMAGGMALAYLVYFSRPFRALLPRLPFQAVVAELDGVFRLARERKGLMLASAGVSVGVQASAILAIYGLALAMGVKGASLWMFFAFEPVIFILTALPISMGGWGVQEAAYRELLGGFGGMDPDGAVALSVLYKLALILVSIPGGVLFGLGATRRRGKGAPPPEGAV